MKPEDYVFNQVYKASMEAGASERAAKDTAIQAMTDYRLSNYKAINTLINDAIKRAKKIT